MISKYLYTKKHFQRKWVKIVSRKSKLLRQILDQTSLSTIKTVSIILVVSAIFEPIFVFDNQSRLGNYRANKNHNGL